MIDYSESSRLRIRRLVLTALLLSHVIVVHLVEVLEMLADAFNFLLLDFDEVCSFFLNLYFFWGVYAVPPESVHLSACKPLELFISEFVNDFVVFFGNFGCFIGDLIELC